MKQMLYTLRLPEALYNRHSSAFIYLFFIDHNQIITSQSRYYHEHEIIPYLWLTNKIEVASLSSCITSMVEVI